MADYDIPPEAVGGTPAPSAAFNSLRGSVQHLAEEMPSCDVYVLEQELDSGEWTSFEFDEERRDAAGMHSTSSSTSRVTAVEEGLYTIHAGVGFGADTDGGRQARVRRNGTQILPIEARNTANQAGSSLTVLAFSQDFYLYEDDFLELQGYHTAGNALTCSATLQVRKVQEPAS